MKERPILFTPENVRAILDGRKTQTRRIVKYIPAMGEPDEWCHRAAAEDRALREIMGDYRRFCPYGSVGGRLWVRETTKLCSVSDAPWVSVHYPADDNVIQYDGRKDYKPLSHFRKTPSIHMPRWACRLVLELTEVRVERLQACSELDAIAEGVKPCGHTSFHVDEHTCSYKDLWASINGADSWDLNPWVWVITFRRAS